MVCTEEENTAVDSRTILRPISSDYRVRFYSDSTGAECLSIIDPRTSNVRAAMNGSAARKLRDILNEVLPE